MHAAQAAVNRRESFYPQPTTRIKVSKLPDNVTENIIRYFFENRRVSGGGVVDTVDYDKTAHTAVVIFEEAEDVQRVIDKGPHLFDEKTIEVERQYIEEESNDRGYDKCTIEVTGMKQSATPFYIQLYFESRKGANSDVLSTDYIEEEEMYLVKFDSEEVVDAVIQKSHVLDGSKLNVRKHIPPQAEATYPKQVFVSGFSIKTSEELFSNYLEARSRVDIDKIIYGDIESTAIVIFKEQPDIDKLKVDCKKRKLDGEYLIIDYVPVSKCVIVSGIKEGISEDIVHYYFDNKRKSGVDGVEVVDLDAINRTCIVYFVDCEAPVEACKRKHSIEGCTVKVDIYHECLGGTACGDGPKCKPLDPIDNTFEPPKHWDIMGDEENYRVVVLKSGSHEYQDVMEKFNGSVGSHRQIQEIHRVQNKTYYQQYLAKKKLIDSTNPPNHQNEKILWHGFAKDVMERINKFGFNRSYCEKINSTAYGAGVYFTTSASLSVWDTYSVPDYNGNKRIYMCKVLTGEYTLGTGRMIIPPQKPSSGGAHNLYDCVVDNLPSPNMYIIFHDTQAYPEYMILFK